MPPCGRGLPSAPQLLLSHSSVSVSVPVPVPSLFLPPALPSPQPRTWVCQCICPRTCFLLIPQRPLAPGVHHPPGSVSAHPHVGKRHPLLWQQEPAEPQLSHPLTLPAVPARRWDVLVWMEIKARKEVLGRESETVG